MLITDKAMQARPPARDLWLIEDGARGAGRFVGRITPAGARSFYYRYTAPDGTRVRQLIGRYDARGDGLASFTVQQARDRARELSGLYRSGHQDLRAHFQQVRETEEAERRAAELEQQRQTEEAERAALAAERRLTVRKLFEHWRQVDLQPRSRADGTRTGRKDGGEWVLQSFERRVFPRLGDVPAEDVKRSELLAILDECKAGGQLRTATILFTDLSQMFRFATNREIVARNPLEGIKRSSIGGPTVERDRVLSDEELRGLWAAVPNARLHPRSVAAIWLILATAVRVGEAMTARWEHIDQAGRTWYLPDTKNQRDHTIHLSDFAIAQLDALRKLREKAPDGKETPWVFPNAAVTGPVDIKTFGKQLADRQRLSDKPMRGRTSATSALALSGGKWTAHDLRRTAATLMARLGVSTDVIDECLNHKPQSRLARIYIRDRREAEQAKAFEALGRWLHDLLYRQRQSNVVAFSPTLLAEESATAFVLATTPCVVDTCVRARLLI
jgi:integrase